MVGRKSVCVVSEVSVGKKWGKWSIIYQRNQVDCSSISSWFTWSQAVGIRVKSKKYVESQSIPSMYVRIIPWNAVKKNYKPNQPFASRSNQLQLIQTVPTIWNPFQTVPTNWNPLQTVPTNCNPLQTVPTNCNPCHAVPTNGNPFRTVNSIISSFCVWRGHISPAGNILSANVEVKNLSRFTNTYVKHWKYLHYILYTV